jgi:hypothetical protein
MKQKHPRISFCFFFEYFSHNYFAVTIIMCNFATIKVCKRWQSSSISPLHEEGEGV